MSESKSYSLIRKNLMLPNERIDRIENVMVAGMPDVNCCVAGIDIWLEIKSPIEPKRESSILFASNHALSIDQRNWMLSQRNSGGTSYIIIHTDKRWMLIDSMYADIINKMASGAMSSFCLWISKTVNPTKEEWTQLRQTLISRSGLRLNHLIIS